MKTSITNSSSFAPKSIFPQEQWKQVGRYAGKPLWWIGLEDSQEAGIAIVVVGQLSAQKKANYLYELMKFSPASVEITDENFRFS